MANNHKTQLQQAGHEPVCLVLEWTSICLCLPGLFKPAFTVMLRALYSADIGITTASSCDGPTLFVTELAGGSSFHQFDPSSAQDFFTADSLQYVSTQPTTVVLQYSRHAYEPHAYVLTYFAVTVSMYTLIPTVYRAFFPLSFLVSGELSTLHQMMKVANEPGLSPNNGLENAFLSDQSMATIPARGKQNDFSDNTYVHTDPDGSPSFAE